MDPNYIDLENVFDVAIQSDHLVITSNKLYEYRVEVNSQDAAVKALKAINELIRKVGEPNQFSSKQPKAKPLTLHMQTRHADLVNYEEPS